MGKGRSKFIKNWELYLMRLFSSGDLLGLGRENNTKEDSGVIAKSCYGDRKVWFSFSVYRVDIMT